MAGAKVRGITIDLGVDTSGFASGLKSANSAINSTAKELRDIDKLLKLDPSNVTLMAQKQETLQRAVTQTKDKLDLLKEAEEKLKAEMVDGGSEEQQRQLAALQREIISTENSLDKYENQLNGTENETRELAQATQQAGQATEGMSQGFTVLKGALANLVADGIRKAVDGFKDMMTAAPAFADEIMTLSSKTSLATDTLQELSYMSGLVDVDVSTVAGSMQKLTKNMASARGGTGATAEAFKTLGISVTDINGQLRDNEDVFFDTIDALGQMENETERDALAMQIFGKSATSLNPMIEAGADALKGFAAEAHDMGYVLDSSAIESLSKVQDEFDRFEKQMESVKIQIASGVAPAIERGMKKLSDVMKKIDWKKIGEQMGKAFDKLIDAFEWIIDNGNLIKSLLTGIVTAMAVGKVMQFVSSVSAMTSALKSATVAQEGMNAAAKANPYILVATAIIGVTSALISFGKGLNQANYEASLHVQKAHELIDASEAQRAANEELVNSYAEASEARTSSMNAGLAEIANAEALAGQLEGLADANGVVAESDKARAEFILGELNNALGTEYSMTGNQIDQYTQLTGAIDELIQKKQAEIMLSAEEDAYREAITNRDAAEQELINTENRRIELQTQLAENEMRAQELSDLVASSGMYNGAFVTELQNINSASAEMQAELDGLNASYPNLAATVDQYAWDVQQYTNNMTSALSGDYASIQHMSWDAAKAQGLASSQASQQVSANAQSAATNWMGSFASLLSQASGKNVEFESVGKGMIQAWVDGQKQGEPMTIAQLTAMRNRMKTDLSKSAADAESVGGSIPTGAAQGIYNNSGYAYTAIKNLGNQMIAEFKATIDSHSPSKVFAGLGKNIVQGVDQGITQNAGLAIGAVENLASGMIAGFNPQLMAGVPSGMMNSMAGSVINNGGSNSIEVNVYGAEGMNVNDLADEVIDKLQRTIIGSEAVYA